MLKVFITGETGYIATHLAKYLLTDDAFAVKKISVRNGVSAHILAGCDAVVHAAAMVHQNERKIPYEAYLEVNTTLTRNLAESAIKAGVKHFIFISTMAVYEGYSSIFNSFFINRETDVSFTSSYASTKYGAEESLNELKGRLPLAVIRPPLVYGRNSPGNFRRLLRFAGVTPFFPATDNVKSMIYIDNLCELIKLILINRKTGLFCPQNAEYINISELVSDMGRLQGNKIHLIKTPRCLLRAVSGVNACRKVFGAFAYDKTFSACFDNAYCVVGYRESLMESAADFIVNKI